MNPRPQHGFTLVEILIVVVILGILAAIVIPQFTDAAQSAEQVAFIADLRNYATAAALYTRDTGEFLEDSGSGAVPAGFDPYINTGKWLEGTPIGGVWDFELNSFGITSAFGVHFQGGGHPGDTFMQQIDLIYDDGDLNTGGFRRIAADRYYHIIER